MLHNTWNVYRWGTIILILSPLLMPIAQEYGIDPVHLGVIIVVNAMTIGLASPPFGSKSVCDKFYVTE